MHAAQYIPDAEFEPAPPGARVRLTTLLSAVVLFMVITVVVVSMARDSNPPPRPAFGAIGAIPVAVVLIFFAGKVRRYRLAGGELRVEFLFRTVRFPLAGLVGATVDREAMRGAWKLYGNDGLGAVSGRYRSKRLGPFRAYLTDVEHAVVLRWSAGCVVISPQQHSYFVEAVRKRAGLSS
jgi:hypothetical protein